MLCDVCKKRPASVHMTKIVNNKKSEWHLCQQCAAEKGESEFLFEPSISVHSLLAGLLNFEPAVESPVSISYRGEEKCPNCGLSYGDFGRTGRLGCGVCYSQFMSRLEPLLRRIQGRGQHTGKIPRRTGGVLKMKSQLNQLRQELQRLVAREEFEKAAQVRDQIRELEKQLGLSG